MAEVTKLELNAMVAEYLEKSFSGLAKTVIPNISNKLNEQVKAFETALSFQASTTIGKNLKDLNKFLENFDVRVTDLGETFAPLEKIRDSLTTDLQKAEEEAAKLREKNIFTEIELVKNKKTGEVQVKTRLLSERQINARKEQIIKDEKKLIEDEKKNLEQVRRLQKGDKDIDKRKGSSIIKEIQNLQERRALIEEEKKLFTGRSGRFDKRIGGFLDDFENALNDRAPDFLIPVIQPLIDVARQVQKTFTLLIDGFNFITNSVKSFPKAILKAGDVIDKTFVQSINFIKKGFINFDKGLQGTFDGVAKGFSVFRKKGLMGSVKALGTFAKRIALAGIMALAAFAPFGIALLKVIGVVALAVGALVLLKKGFDFLMNNMDVVKEKFANFGEMLVNVKDFVKEKLESFANGVKEIPQKISDFFSDIFVKIKNFFIDSINSVITLINKIKPGKDIELLERVETPVKVEEPKEFENKDEGKVDPALQKAADQAKIDEIRGTEDPIINDIQKTNEVFNKEIDDFQTQKDKFINEQESKIPFLSKDMNTLDIENKINELLKDPKKFELTPESMKEAIQPVVINNVTAPQNVASSSTQQVVAANAAKSNDDTFLNLNRHV